MFTREFFFLGKVIRFVLILFLNNMDLEYTMLRIFSEKFDNIRKIKSVHVINNILYVLIYNNYMSRSFGGYFSN